MDDYYRYDSPLKDDATRWEIGCSNFIGRIGLGAGIKLLQEIGIENIEQRVFDLNDYLIARLQKRGYRVASPTASRAERSGILCFNHPAREAKELFACLMAAKVAVSLRGQVIRVAPHFYNNEEDLDRLLLALPA
jgi:cysteine desulfurase / selenocysteine lyase